MASEVRRDLAAEITVYDGETHTGESRADLLEYLPDEVRRDEERGYIGIGTEKFGPIQWDGWDRSLGGRIAFDNFGIPHAEAYEVKRKEMGIDKVVFSPGLGFRFTVIPDHETRIAYMRAFNSLNVERFARGDGTYYSKMLVIVDHVRESVEEIERVGGEKGIVGIFLTDIGPSFPLGHQMYEPIYDAAEKYDLPIILHSTTGIHPGFPTAGMNPKNFLEYHTLAHTIPKMWHAQSLITRGIVERYDIKWGFWEAGLSWAQVLAWRLDREYFERSSEMADLRKRPSEHLSDFYYGSQPLEEPRDPTHLGVMIEMNDLEDQVVYTSDVPHMDFDSTRAVSGHEGLSREQKIKIFQDNPRRIFGI